MAVPINATYCNSPVLSHGNSVLLDRNQNQGRGTIVFKPRPEGVPVARGDDSGGDTRDKAEIVSQESIGLRERPILVQRGEDAIASGQFLKLAQDGSLENYQTPAQTIQAKVAQAAPTGPAPLEVVHPAGSSPAYVAVPAVTRPKTAAKLTSDSLGTIRMFCTDLIVNDSTIVLVFALDGSTSVVEPPVRGMSEIFVLDCAGAKYKCASFGLSFERSNELSIVLLRVPG